MVEWKEWKDREKRYINQNILDDDLIKQEISSRFNATMRDIQKEIDSFYRKYATDNKISMSEARLKVDKFDVESFSHRVKSLIEKGDLTSVEKAQLKLYNMTMSINRLEMLKANIGVSIVELYSEEQAQELKRLNMKYYSELQRQSGILGNTITHDQIQSMDEIMRGSYHDAKWSEKIWNNQYLLKAEIDKLLNRVIIRGEHPNAVSRDLQKLFDVSRYEATRIARTESALIQGEVQAQSYEVMGYDKYKYIAEPTACPICKRLDDEVFLVKDRQLGVNFYPMHPNCMCSSSAYMDKMEI